MCKIGLMNTSEKTKMKVVLYKRIMTTSPIRLLLKVHKREKFFVSDFEFFTILQLVKLKY
jgi:hypothetical protein